MAPLARTAAVLTLGNLITRTLGLLYRLLLVRWLGGEGLGLFQVAVSIYFAIVQPFASSLPAALSQVLAAARGGGGPRPEERRLLLQTALLSAALALGAALVAARLPSGLLGDAWRAARQLLPLPLLHGTLVCAVTAAALRGLLLAYRRPGAMAAALVAEQAVRIAVVSALLSSAAAAAAGMAWRVRAVLWNLLLGELVDALVLLWAAARLMAQPWPLHPPPPERAARLAGVLRLAVPIAAQRAFFALEHLVEAALIPALLQRSGMTLARALAAYGAMVGVAVPLLQLPMVAVGALAQALVPAVAEVAHSPPARARRVGRALALAAEVGGAAGLAFTLAGPELARWLYAADAAGPVAMTVVALLSPAALFAYVDVTAAAALRGLGRAHEPLLVDVLSALVRFGLLLWWAGHLRLGLAGVAAAVVTAGALACVLDVWLAARRVGLAAAEVTALAVPPAAAAAAWVAIRGAFPEGAQPWLELAAGAAAYALLRIALRLILPPAARRT